jgi:hypothetical protein
MNPRHDTPTTQPQSYRIVSGPVGIGAVVTAIQYVGTRDNLDAIARMLGMGAFQVGEPLPALRMDGALVDVGDWITYSHGRADVLSAEWFDAHYQHVDTEN